MSEETSQFLLIVFGGIFLAVIMSVFIIGLILIHRQRQIQNRQRISQLQAEYEKTLLNIENEIQQETLSRIGRELHDNIGQLLSLAKLNFGSVKPEKHAEGRLILTQVIQEVRNLSKTLNLDWVEMMDLEGFILQQLNQIKSTGFCEVSLESGKDLPPLSKDLKLVLIRVIQEILNNAIKHANPDNIRVRISKQDGWVIQIKDDGRGFDPLIKSEGSGMYNLKKRMETIGGKFELISSEGNGTEINLALPI